jgi:hypothetical protein
MPRNDAQLSGERHLEIRDPGKRVAFVIVKESGDLLTQMYGMAWISARHGMFEKRFLDIGREFGPLRDDGGSKALEDMLFGKAQDKMFLVALLVTVF